MLHLQAYLAVTHILGIFLFYIIPFSFFHNKVFKTFHYKIPGALFMPYLTDVKNCVSVAAKSVLSLTLLLRRFY